MVNTTLHSLTTATRYYVEMECPILRDDFTQQEAIPVITTCGHMVSLKALAQHCGSSKNCLCPVCRQPLTLKILLNGTIVP